jgi:hypothetical protein
MDQLRAFQTGKIGSNMAHIRVREVCSIEVSYVQTHTRQIHERQTASRKTRFCSRPLTLNALEPGPECRPVKVLDSAYFSGYKGTCIHNNEECFLGISGAEH